MWNCQPFSGNRHAQFEISDVTRMPSQASLRKPLFCDRCLARFISPIDQTEFLWAGQSLVTRKSLYRIPKRSQPLFGHKDLGRLQQSLTKNTEISGESRGGRPCSNTRVTGASRLERSKKEGDTHVWKGQITARII